MPLYHRYSLIFVLMLSLAGCHRPKQSGKDRTDLSTEKGVMDLDSTLLIKFVFVHSRCSFMSQTVIDFYRQNGYRSVWMTEHGATELSRTFTQAVCDANQWGLDSERLHLPLVPESNGISDVSLASYEAALTIRAISFLSQVGYGSMRSQSIFSEDHHLFYRQRIIGAFKDAVSSHRFLDAVGAVQPDYIQYNRIQKAAAAIQLPRFSHSNFCWVARAVDDTLLWQVFSQLGYDTGHLPPNDKNRALLLRSFQKSNQLGVTGEYDFWTYAKLYTETRKWVDLLAVNLDRLRQSPPLQRNYVWVNIPAYKLDVVMDNHLVHSTRVVVGAPKTPTPVLSGKLSHVITYPSWNIPGSIIQNEIIPAMQRDSNYLSKKGYRVDTWSGQNLPVSVVLSRIYESDYLPFNISQPPGSDNALGTLKFLFDNSASVYLHDTNAKSFFSRQSRALSHGCIRVQDPHKLAVLLLDSAAVARMDKQLANKTSGHIPIKKECGVYLRYITCDVLNDGKLVQFPDVYRYDAIDREKMAAGCLQ